VFRRDGTLARNVTDRPCVPTPVPTVWFLVLPRDPFAQDRWADRKSKGATVEEAWIRAEPCAAQYRELSSNRAPSRFVICVHCAVTEQGRPWSYIVLVMSKVLCIVHMVPGYSYCIGVHRVAKDNIPDEEKDAEDLVDVHTALYFCSTAVVQ